MTTRLLAKRALAALSRLSVRPSTDRRIILLYHSVGGGPFATTESAFRDEMAWLRNHASVVDLATLADTHDASSPRVAITFDDGYASLHRSALSILDRLGLPATVFVNSGLVGSRDRKRSDPAQGHYPDESFLLWSEVQDLVDSGWDVGSHGVDHLDLTRVTENEAGHQLIRSRTDIEDKLSRPCEMFAYTWGRHSPRLRKQVADSGYRLAFAGNHRVVDAATDPFAIPRINIARDYTLDDFKAIVRGDWDYLGWVQKARMRLST